MSTSSQLTCNAFLFVTHFYQTTNLPGALLGRPDASAEADADASTDAYADADANAVADADADAKANLGGPLG